MEFKELMVDELRKEIKEYLKTKTPDEIIDILESYEV